MEPWVVVTANVLGIAVLFGGIALCVRFDQQGKTRRRELEHTERMRAIELGRPLDVASVARYQALGAVGVAVPIASLSAAVIGSCFAMLFKEPEWRFGALAVVWLVCGAVCLVVLPVVSTRLREPPPGRPAGDAQPTPSLESDRLM
jgi:hypothetical protein